MELQLKIIGFILIFLGFAHIGFPKYFKWKSEFRSVSVINRQMMYIHTLFLSLMLILVGLLCLSSSNELVTTKLGNRLCLGLACFWFLRLIVQFFGYSPELWKGKRLESTIHIVFIVLWTYLTIIFSWVFY